MASVGHLAAGLAAGRFAGSRDSSATSRRARWQWTLGLTVLSFLPDADVISFALNVPYEATWGHRGAPHSIALAALLGAAIGAVARYLGRPDALKIALWCGAVTASHGILDAFTDGGEGIALFWPITDARYFAPWRPIPVSPIGANFLSLRGLEVALTELLMFGPLLIYALWPWRPRNPNSSSA